METLRQVEEMEQQVVYQAEYDQWEKEWTLPHYIQQRKKGFDEDYSKKQWVYTVNQQVIGSIVCHNFELPHIHVTGLSSVLVFEEWRNQGIGNKMMRTCMDQSPETDVFLLYSAIGETYYEKLGFKTMPRKYQKYDDLILMVHCDDDVFHYLKTLKPYQFPDYFY